MATKDYMTCSFCGCIIEGEPVEVGDRCYCDEDCARLDGCHECESCGSIVSDDECEYIDGCYYCDEDCADADGYVRCEHCGEWVSRDYAVYVDYNGEWYCDEGCADAEGYERCERCGEWVYNGETYYVLNPYGETWCERCTDNFAVYCSDCDEYYAEDEGRCPRCGCSNLLHEYGFTPHITYHGVNDNTPYLGIELETDAHYDANRTGYTKALSELDSFNDLFWMTRDGSLNNGVEITGQPMTLEFAVQNHELFEQIADTAREYEFKSHDAGTCGLHVHISRSFFGKSDKAQVYGGFKMMRLLQRFKRQFTILSRREETGWCRFETRYDYAPKTVVPKIINDYEPSYMCGSVFEKSRAMVYREDDHNQVLNFQHYNTFELRMFRGTLNMHSLFASLALANGLAHVAKSRSSEWCETVDWYTLISEIVNAVDNKFAKDELDAYVVEKALR